MIAIGEPFNDPAPGKDRAEQLDGLVRQYAAHHLKVLTARPANTPWFQMKQHLTFPELDDGRTALEELLKKGGGS